MVQKEKSQLRHIQGQDPRRSQDHSLRIDQKEGQGHEIGEGYVDPDLRLEVGDQDQEVEGPDQEVEGQGQDQEVEGQDLEEEDQGQKEEDQGQKKEDLGQEVKVQTDSGEVNMVTLTLTGF